MYRFKPTVDVQQRWKVLRDRFVRELKKKKKPTGSAANNSSTWDLLEHMMFLKDFVKHRRYNYVLDTHYSFSILNYF